MHRQRACGWEIEDLGLSPRVGFGVGRRRARKRRGRRRRRSRLDW